MNQNHFYNGYIELFFRPSRSTGDDFNHLVIDKE